jgi:hypothetical protein
VSSQLVLTLAQVALALVVAVAACLVLRRRLITRGGGVVECCLRATPSGRWQQGLAEYRTGQLCWHRSLSLALGPQAVFDRRGLVLVGSRPVGAGDAPWLGSGTMIVTCRARPEQARRPRSSGAWPDQARARYAGQRADAVVIQLAMSRAALTGYLAWLEAAPAGYLSQAS